MSPTFVFVACGAEGTVDIFSLDVATGSLEPVGRESGLDVVRSMAVNHRDSVLYVGMNTKIPQLRSFNINADSGALTAVSAVELPATNTYLCLAHDHSQLYSASYLNGVVTSVPVLANGVLGGEAVVACSPGPQTHSAASSPDGRHIYASSLGADRLVWYIPGAGGQLVQAGFVTSANGSGPRHFRFTQDGTKLYVVHEMSGVVTVFDREPCSGQLTENQSVQSVPTQLQLSVGTIHAPSAPPVDPSVSPIWCADVQLAGDFLFTTERTSSTISTFAVDAETGLLEYLRVTPTETQPRGAALSPSNEFLLVSGEKSNGMSTYRIDPATGVLELSARVQTGGGPLWMDCYTQE